MQSSQFQNAPIAGQFDTDAIPKLWRKTLYFGTNRRLITDEAWMAERIRYGAVLLRECVEIDPDIRSGVPVLRGTRFTISQLLAELAEGRSVPEIATAFRLNQEQLQKVLESFAIWLDRPIVP